MVKVFPKLMSSNSAQTYSHGYELQAEPKSTTMNRPSRRTSKYASKDSLRDNGTSEHDHYAVSVEEAGAPSVESPQQARSFVV
jgi:hypothetical protein